MDIIKLNKSGIKRFEIQEANGESTGEYLEFDLESIDLPLRLQECEENHRKNLQWIRNQFTIIEKKQDHKGKKLLSSNEEAKIKALNEFYKKEMEALDLFLGENGTKKLLNGRRPYYSMYDDINDMLEPILPTLKQGFTDIETKIKNKYSKKEENIIE